MAIGPLLPPWRAHMENPWVKDNLLRPCESQVACGKRPGRNGNASRSLSGDQEAPTKMSRAGQHRSKSHPEGHTAASKATPMTKDAAWDTSLVLLADWRVTPSLKLALWFVHLARPV